MSVAQLIALARKRWKVTTNMISDVDMLEYLNIRYTDIHAAIVNIDKNYFWDEWITNTVADQSEYTLLESDAATKTFWQYKIEKLGIKYRDNQDTYTNILLKDWDEYDIDSSYLEKYGVCNWWCTWWCAYCRLTPRWWCNAGSPIAMISDKSIFIYPAPKESVVWWLKIQASRDLYELDLTMTQDDILIVKGYSELLTIWMLIDIYRERNLLNEKNDAVAEYNTSMDRMLKDLAMRKTTFVTWNRPNLSRFS